MTDRSASEAGESPTLLIVDDERSGLQLLSASLTKRGYRIIEAETGEDALRLLQNGALPDLVIMDIMMPNLDGFETLQLIRERFQATELPVILLTALGEKQDVVRGLE